MGTDMNRMVLLAVSAALLLVPMSQTAAQGGGSSGDAIGDTDQVTFYGHVFNHGLSAPQPSNTEPPIGENLYGRGTFDWCTPAGSVTGLVPDPRPGETCQQNQWHKLALFSTAGPVDVDSRTEFQAEGGYGLLHNERGQTKDIQLDTSGNVKATIYLTVDYHAWSVSTGETSCVQPHPENVPCLYPYWGWDVGTQTDFVVEATLYQADLGSRTNSSQAPPVQEAIESGKAEVVAQGQWGPEQATTGLPGFPNAQQFDIDLGNPQTDTIDRDKDFFLVYDTFSETPGGRVATHTVRWWSGEFFPPSYEMPVKNAFTVERVVPSPAHGRLAILGIMNTPWGSYDVDGESVEIDIDGPNGQSVSADQLTRYSDFSVAHGGHFKPVNVTWIWDYRKQDLDPGTYELTVSGANLQGSSAAECTASLTLEQSEQGPLTVGNVNEGKCGTQSVSSETVEDLKEGASDQAGGSDE